jgi:ribosomal small subunit protein bTHX
MGKGDIKTRKGKLANGSFGRLRLRNETAPKKENKVVAESAPATKKAVASRAKAKKA